ncbi:MAG: FAD-binding oxidoreductase [Pseudomonadota bacterium]
MAAYPNSYYAASAAPSLEAPQLAGDLTCDVCVVGGGYTGLSAALHLAERGYEVVLLEAKRVGWGASGRNGGQLGAAQVDMQPELVRRYGPERARALWQIAADGKDLVKRLIEKHGIDCAFTTGHMGCAVKPADLARFEAHADFVAEHYGYRHYRVVGRDETAALSGTGRYQGALFDASAGHLHPLNLALGLARAAMAAGARIFEASPVEEFRPGDPVTVKTERGQIRAHFLLLGCNGYLGRLVPEIAGHILPAENYQLATAPLPEGLAEGVITNNACLWDTHHQVYYYRKSPEGRLIFGGGVGYAGSAPKDMTAVVRRHMLKIYPQLAAVPIDYAWGGTFANTLSRVPDLGRLAPNVFYAQGYTGHGVALATAAGQILADLVAGTAERFDLLAAIPQRDFPGGAVLRVPVLTLGFLYIWLMDRLRI